MSKERMTNTGILLQKIDAGVNKVAQEVPFSRRDVIKGLLFTASVPGMLREAGAKDVKEGFDLLGIKEKKIPVVPLEKIIDKPDKYKEGKFITDGFLKPESGVKLGDKYFSSYDLHTENKDESPSILELIYEPEKFGIEPINEKNKNNTVFERSVVQGKVESVTIKPAEIHLGNVIIAERVAIIK